MPPIPGRPPKVLITTNPEPEMEWVSRPFRMVCWDSKTRPAAITVPAKCLPGVAVHRSQRDGQDVLPESERLWAVSSFTTGLWIVDLMTEEDAVRVAETLQLRCGEALAWKTAQEVRNALPRKVVNWLRSVRLRKKYLPLEG